MVRNPGKLLGVLQATSDTCLGNVPAGLFRSICVLPSAGSRPVCNALGAWNTSRHSGDATCCAGKNRGGTTGHYHRMTGGALVHPDSSIAVLPAPETMTTGMPWLPMPPPTSDTCKILTCVTSLGSSPVTTSPCPVRPTAQEVVIHKFRRFDDVPLNDSNLDPGQQTSPWKG